MTNEQVLQLPKRSKLEVASISVATSMLMTDVGDDMLVTDVDDNFEMLATVTKKSPMSP